MTRSDESVPRTGTFRLPVCDIIEKDDEYIIESEMPGTRQEDVDIHYLHGELTVTGKKCHTHCGPEAVKSRKYRVRQFECHDYSRTFRIGDTIKTDSIRADYQNGVVTVHLPKSEAVKPRKIELSKS